MVKNVFIHKEEAEGTSMTNDQWSIIPAPGARSEYTEYTDQYCKYWPILLILIDTDPYCPRAVVVKDGFIHKEETEVDGGFQATMLTEDTDQHWPILFSCLCSEKTS